MQNPDAITLKQLRTLAMIVEAGSLSRAAERLHITPPAVTVQLKALEEHVGARLLDRGPDGRVSPTPAGQEMLRLAARIDNILSLAIKGVTQIIEGKSGLVPLGVVSTAKYFAPYLVAAAQKAFPDIEVDLFVGNRAEIIGALADRRVDLAVMGRPPRVPPVEADILGDHPHVLICPPDHPLAGACDVSPDRLMAETFLVRERGSGTRILMDRYLETIGGGRVFLRKEVGSNETIKRAVMAGLGLALISASAVGPELAHGELATINPPEMPIVRQWFLVRRAGRELSPAGENVRQFIRTDGWASVKDHALGRK